MELLKKLLRGALPKKKRKGQLRLWAMVGSSLMGAGAAGFFSGDPMNSVAQGTAGGFLMGAGAVTFGAGAAMAMGL